MTNLIIAVINQKGGTGKTTLALNLSAGLAKRGSVHLVDADPQRSVTQWVGMGGGSSGLPGVAQLVGNPTAIFGRLSRSHRFIVVDCPPTVQGDTVKTILRMASIVLIPTLPSPLDLWASVDMAVAVNEAKKDNAGLKAFLVLNQLETRNSLSRDMRDAVAEFDVPVLIASMQRRAIYRSAAIEGQSVYGIGKRGAQAVADIEAIIEEIL